MTPLKTFQNLSKPKQKRITRAAVEEFSEKGFTGASINAIVKNLGIAKGSIFQYFGDKQGLFLFVFNQAMEMVKDYLRTVRDQTEDEELFSRLEKTLLAGVHFLREHPLLYTLYLKVLFESQIPFRNKILASLRSYSHEYLYSLLETAKDRGELRENIDLDKTSFVLDAIMDRFLQAQAIQHLDAGLGLYKTDEENARDWIAGIVDIMRIGIGCEE
ncbi:MAG: TetR/AcrR family transcriptional regulator [Deltaproteobacteria bacterium]|nr:TetR/AcrR family transcriptional regulator [Deltaproteobacteria bacterium]MBW2100551.1 TetR/AcrR family transcriptional regulator [Deltaproteobacteria bacterium]